MGKGRNHIVDQVFRAELEGAKLPVSAPVWTAIESELEKDKLRRKVLWARTTAAAAVAMLIAVGAWSLYRPAGLEGRALALAPFEGIHLPEQRAALGDRHEGLASAKKDALTDADRSASAMHQADMRNETSFTAASVHGASVHGASVHGASIPPASVQAIAAAQTDIEELRSTIGPNLLSSLGPKLLSSLALPEELINAKRNSDAWVYDQILWTSPEASAAEKKPGKADREIILAWDDDSEKKEKKWQWLVGGAFSPDRTFGSTTPVPMSESARSSNSMLAARATEAETRSVAPVTAYSSGFRVAVGFNERFALRSGLMLSSRQTTVNQEVIAFGKTQTYDSNLELYFVEIPLSLRYNVVHSKRLDYFVASGLSTNLFVHYENSLHSSNGKVAEKRISETYETFRPSQASMLLSTGMQYRVWDKLSLQLEPGLRYGFLTNEYAFSQPKPVALSLLSGVNFSF